MPLAYKAYQRARS